MTAPSVDDLTPARIVTELDRYVVGQNAAKRAVAVAIRNRWRRMRLSPELREEVTPKNILLVGPTGVGKTEIARRIAGLIRAPFVKVEATKYTEVGYVGRDVESIVRDLVEASMALVRAESRVAVEAKARAAAEERVLDALLPGSRPTDPSLDPFGFARSAAAAAPSAPPEGAATRARLRERLRAGALDDRDVDVEVVEGGQALGNVFGAPGLEAAGLDLSALLDKMGPGRKKTRRMKVPEALSVLVGQEADKLLDRDAVAAEAVRRAEQTGIVFLDELDKVAGRRTAGGADVSREGVQRDLLPLVEGTTVATRHGPVRTEHVLFIAAGAFHVSKPSDLMPELQGRFPIRVQLEPLTEADFVRILEEPRNALVKQYAALLGAEDVRLTFTPDGVRELARVAAAANAAHENIGARRLATVLERTVEEIAFDAPSLAGTEVVVDAAFVRRRTSALLADEDLARYVL